ncbi:MAG: ABC transporter permease [Muribaculaceae bacterium]|nr:ABC transporter permease [Muribaculaceae bacterium]
MSNIKNKILTPFIDIFMVWKREFRNVFKDVGVMIFFLALPTLYPIVYSLIYNTELAREVPVIVVDDCRTEGSREFVRNIDASQYAHVVGYAANMEEAKRGMHEKEAYGILQLPSDFTESLGRGVQANANLYCDMSLLIRYKGLLISLTNVAMEMGAKIQAQKIDDFAPSYTPVASNPIPSFSIFMGNPEQGFASFVLPGILVLILQQSLVLGIAFLGVGERDRRKKNNGYDPCSANAGIIPTMIGKAMCYYTIYVAITVYILHFVPHFFSFPQFGNIDQIYTFIMPFLFASIFMGMVFQNFIRQREDAFLIIVFTSVIFLFLSGLTWPRYAMNRFWILLGDIIPGTWGVEGFIRMNGDGATLEQTAYPYTMLWILTGAYFIIAYACYRFIDRRRKIKQ